MPTFKASAGATAVLYRLPDAPERHWDEVTANEFVYDTGATLNLSVHFGRQDSTLVTAGRWVIAAPNTGPILLPDLLIAFDVSAERYREQNGYVISDQGKPPDFVLEVASPSTAQRDTGYKRVEYAAMGIPEYWRFDHTGESHGARLAGDRLVGDTYEPIPIVEVASDVLEGVSTAINLTLRWEDGELLWIDPATNQPLPGLESERAARLEERAARLAAEDRVEALEAELRRLREERNE